MVPISTATHEAGHINVTQGPLEVDINRGSFLTETVVSAVPMVAQPIPNPTIGFVGAVSLLVEDLIGPDNTTVTVAAFGQTSPCSIAITLPLVRGCTVLTSQAVTAPNPQVTLGEVRVCLYLSTISVKAAGIPIASTGNLVEPVVNLNGAACPASA